MSQSTARKIAKVIAILIIVAMVLTSFSFVFLSVGQSVSYAATTQVVPAKIAAAQTTQALTATITATEDSAYINSELDFMKQLVQDIKKNYKDDVTYKQMIDGAFKGIFESLDPHSVYYATTEARDDFVTTVDGEFSGVGVSLDTASGQCVVVAPISGTPAAKAGILPGDIVVEVDGKDVRKLTGDEIVALLRGAVGTKVSLGIERAGSNGVITFALIREVIKVKAVSGKMLENGIGYIKIDSFDNDTDKEFTAMKLQLLAQGMTKMIIDLRNNPGGYIDVAANIADQIMPAGTIVSFEKQGKTVDKITASGVGITHLKIAVLINNGSASSSEILAGALQDTKSAVLVGEQSYGKGTAQQVIELANGASMKLSKYYFLTPSNRKIDHVGLTPDYVVTNKIGSEAENKLMLSRVTAFAPMIENTKPKAGDKGLNVYGAQERLAFLGYKLQASGVMDAATVSSVKLFQKSSGLYAYGGLDNTTRMALSKAITDYVSKATVDGSDPQLLKAIEIVQK